MGDGMDMSHQWQFEVQGFGTGGERVRWTDLVAVAIRASSDGPWLDDVYWQFAVANDVD
ncbi:MAG: hypothetical protein AB7P03_30730 [Kofleriaceae bacterium]